MKAYRVVGKFPNGKTIQQFTQDVVASDKSQAEHIIYSSLGSRHRATRRSIKIESVEQIDPKNSTEAKVISAFRGKNSPTPAKSSSEEE